MLGYSLQELGVAQQPPELADDIGANVVKRSLYLAHDLFATVKEDNDVFEVMTEAVVLLPPSPERFELGGD